MKLLPIGFNPIPKSNKKALEVIEQVSEQARRIANPPRSAAEAKENAFRDAALKIEKFISKNKSNNVNDGLDTANKKAFEVVDAINDKAMRIANPPRNIDEVRETAIRDGIKALNKPDKNIPNLDEYMRGYTMALQGKVPAKEMEVHKMNALLTGNTSFLEGLKAAVKNQK